MTKRHHRDAEQHAVLLEERSAELSRQECERDVAQPERRVERADQCAEVARGEREQQVRVRGTEHERLE